MEMSPSLFSYEKLYKKTTKDIIVSGYIINVCYIILFIATSTTRANSLLSMTLAQQCFVVVCRY